TKIPRLRIPASRTGFLLDAPSSRLSGLVLDGADDAGTPVGTTGVEVGMLPVGTTDPPTLDHVSVMNLSGPAIAVASGGALVCSAGTTVTASQDGISIARGGQATIDPGSDGADPISVSGNTGHGVVVNGSLVARNVLVSANGSDGVVIEQGSADHTLLYSV